MDSYFVIGCYERKDKPKIIKFRVDKICSIQITDEDRIPCPEDFDLSAFCDSMFLMYLPSCVDSTGGDRTGR